VEFDKGASYDPLALERLQLSDENVLKEYLAVYGEVIQTDIEEVTAFVSGRGY